MPYSFRPVKRADLRTRAAYADGIPESTSSTRPPITKYAVTSYPNLRITSIRHSEPARHVGRPVGSTSRWTFSRGDRESSLLAFDPRTRPQRPSENLLPRVHEAIRLLNDAQRPVILVGNGVRLGGAAARFLELAELLHVPVLATWKAMDLLPEDHPLLIGRPGAVGQRAANLAQQNADWLLVLGAVSTWPDRLRASLLCPGGKEDRRRDRSSRTRQAPDARRGADLRQHRRLVEMFPRRA